MGSNDSIYGPVRSGIIQQKPIPLIKQIVTHITKKNNIGNLCIPPSTTAKWELLLQPWKPGCQNRRTDGFCFQDLFSLPQYWHDISSSFQIVGYQDWWEKGKPPTSGVDGRTAPIGGGNSRRRGSVRPNAAEDADRWPADTVEATTSPARCAATVTTATPVADLSDLQHKMWTTAFQTFPLFNGTLYWLLLDI